MFALFIHVGSGLASSADPVVGPASVLTEHCTCQCCSAKASGNLLRDALLFSLGGMQVQQSEGKTDKVPCFQITLRHFQRLPVQNKW
jgi:hypothetical protein